MTMLSHFPLAKPRASQVQVLQAIEKAYADGFQNVLLEAPVGSGKSAIAIAVAKSLGDSHVLTPRKALQDQYVEDFTDQHLALMKGRSAYPCTFDEPDEVAYNKAIRLIQQGRFVPLSTDKTCGQGPCSSSSYGKVVYEACTKSGAKPCPYQVAVTKACSSDTVVHNLHSFIYQAYLAGKFDQRSSFILDECHEAEDIVREFATRKFTIPQVVEPGDWTQRLTHMYMWADYLETFLAIVQARLSYDKFGVSNVDKYKAGVQSLRDIPDDGEGGYVPHLEVDERNDCTRVSFIPIKVGPVSNSLLYSFGDKRLLMSGTIYSKSVFSGMNGLAEEDTCFIRTSTSFSQANRPIYLKKDYTLDLSHKMWDQNFGRMIDNIRKVLGVFHDVKGLIHVPSYMAMDQLALALRDTGRVHTHTREDVSQRLTAFYSSQGNGVFLSPVCQQGVDFKYDRARFQIILRVPYLNTSDPFVAHQVKNNFSWYNMKALVTFGQQIGRVVRAEDDFGATVLMDERFNGFIQKNSRILPKWVTDSVIYK